MDENDNRSNEGSTSENGPNIGNSPAKAPPNTSTTQKGGHNPNAYPGDDPKSGETQSSNTD